jgi:poly [ADP-ribose] polymerase 2/3/4
MAPKRKKKVEEEKVEDKVEDENPSKKQKLRNAKVDPLYGSGKVYNDGKCVYDAMLNQTNISKNNNKFYVIQLIEDSGSYVCYTRWGRVGEDGQSQEKSFSNAKDGIKEFCNKFKAKSANKWEDRDSFVPKSGKYTMVEIADDEEEETKEEVKKIIKTDDGKIQKIKDSKHCKQVQDLINLIFSNGKFIFK